jgi:hypothetical protein
MSFNRVVVALSASLLATAAFAKAPEMRPGLWEFTMSGIPMKQTVCITPEMANDVTKLGKDDSMPNDCKHTAPKVSGKSTNFDISCTKPLKMKTRMTLTSHSSDSFTMAQDFDMEIDGQRQKGSMNIDYKRVGDCK